MFVAFGIFVIDVGNWWVHKRHLQTQADAAALAGAREYRFPACSNQDDRRGGGRLLGRRPRRSRRELRGVRRHAAELQPPAGGERASAVGPTQGIHTQVNTPDPWDGQHPTDRKNDVKWVDDDPASTNDGDLKDMLPADRKPCSAMMLDVKLTETDIAGRFSPLRFLDVLGFVDFIDARARVELRQQVAGTDMLPLAVEDLNPKRVHVWLYDEDTQELLGDAELEPRDPEDGLLIYDNSVAGGGTPMAVNLDRETINGQDVTKQRIGVKVGFSGTTRSTAPSRGVSCYGTAADGITRDPRLARIRGPATRRPPRARTAIDNDGDGIDSGSPATRTAAACASAR